MSTRSCTSAVDPIGARGTEQLDLGAGQVGVREDPVADRIVDVVVDVGDAIDDAYDLPLQRLRLLSTGVREDAVADLVGEVEPQGDAPRLLVVAEAAPERGVERIVERLLTRVTERRVAGVVPEADRLDEVLVQPQRPRDDARDRGRLERVGHPRAVVVALGVDEDLCLPLQAPERLRVDEAVAIALKRRSDAHTAPRARPCRGFRRSARLVARATVPRAPASACSNDCPMVPAVSIGLSVVAVPDRPATPGYPEAVRRPGARLSTTRLRRGGALLLAATVAACGGSEAVDEGPFGYDASRPLATTDRGVVDDDYPIAVHDVSYAAGDDTVDAFLAVPPGTARRPAVVYVHGAGSTRDSMIGPALWLAARGAVTLAITAPSSRRGASRGHDRRSTGSAGRGRSRSGTWWPCGARSTSSPRATTSIRIGSGSSAGARAPEAGAILSGVEPRLHSLVLVSGGSATVSEFVHAAPAELRPQVEETMSSIDPLRYIAKARPGSLLLQDGRRDCGHPAEARCRR